MGAGFSVYRIMAALAGLYRLFMLPADHGIDTKNGPGERVPGPVVYLLQIVVNRYTGK